MFRASILLLITMCSFKQGFGEFVLTSSPGHLHVGITENVTLRCNFRDNVSFDSFQTVSRLRILKEIWSENFDIVAEVREHESGVIVEDLDSSAKVVGAINDVASSFISISWQLATSDLLGTYQCDIIGYKANLDLLVEKTPVVVLEETPPTIQEALDLWNTHREAIAQKIQLQKAYCDNLVSSIDLYINAEVAQIEASQRNVSAVIQQAVLQKTAGLSNDITSLKNTGVFQYWPEGTYALLTPDSGCPDNVGAIWGVGFRQFHTESTDRNYDTYSTPTHLQAPIMQRVVTDNFMYQHFCVSSRRSPGPAWPPGSYCINQVTPGCPGGFGSGAIHWRNEITNSKSAVSGILPFGTYAANDTVIYYCCRSDGPAATPIYLPRSRPFYLYRFNSVCQNVAGMSTSSEFMIFDTDTSNADSYLNTNHPDGTINNVRVELCYYSPV